jgi:YVTN family beta-propeller protein
MTFTYVQTLRRSVILAVVLISVSANTFGQVRIMQTNSRGDNVHIIDPATNEVVGEIKGIPIPHGIAAAPDGSRFYVSGEADHTLDVVDGGTLQVTKSIPLSGRPNNISIGPDGRRVYVAINAPPGPVDVIDTESLENVKTIPNDGGVHNVYVTPDGKHVLAGSISGRHLTVIDSETEEPVWKLFDQGVRPMAIEANPDGSTGRIFVQLSLFHGFVVVDFAQRKEVARIELPSVPPEQQAEGTFNDAPAHGIGVAPDGKTLWVTSRLNSHVYAYALPGLELLGGIEVGDDPDWVTFTPDSKTVYVANAISNDVSAIDVETLKEIARIPVGNSPKRNTTVEFR